MLLNLRKHEQPDDDKNYLHIKDPFESKYQLLINGREKLGIRHEKKNLNAFFIDEVYDNLGDNS